MLQESKIFSQNYQHFYKNVFKSILQKVSILENKKPLFDKESMPFSFHYAHAIQLHTDNGIYSVRTDTNSTGTAAFWIKPSSPQSLDQQSVEINERILNITTAQNDEGYIYKISIETTNHEWTFFAADIKQEDNQINYKLNDKMILAFNQKKDVVIFESVLGKNEGLQKVYEAFLVEAKKIDAPTKDFPTFGYSQDMAWPYIEVEESGEMYYRFKEKGQVTTKGSTKELDELLYWIFKDITFRMSTEFELNNRDNNIDGRRIIFKMQLELMKILKPAWEEILAQSIHDIIQNYPFDDAAHHRAAYSALLRKKGLSETDIEREARSKFP